MRVLVTDLSVRSVDHQLTFLIASDPSASIDSLLLGWVNRRDSLIPFATHSPLPVVRYNMLIFSHSHTL